MSLRNRVRIFIPMIGATSSGRGSVHGYLDVRYDSSTRPVGARHLPATRRAEGDRKAPGQLLSMLGALRAGGLMEVRTTGRAQHETYEATPKGRTALLTIAETLSTTDADTRLMD